jgi:hypothetical protein
VNCKEPTINIQREREAAIWKIEKANCLHRDHYRCRVKGCRITGSKNLSVHHIKPRSEGGKTKQRNLITLCHKHHDIVESNLNTFWNIERIKSLKNIMEILSYKKDDKSGTCENDTEEMKDCIKTDNLEIFDEKNAEKSNSLEGQKNRNRHVREIVIDPRCAVAGHDWRVEGFKVYCVRCRVSNSSGAY